MSYETAIYFRVKNERAADSGDEQTFNLHGVNAQETPAPVVYVDGSEAAAESYTFNCGDASTRASITFDEAQTGSTVTCDYRWKYELPPAEELSVYEFDKTLNVKTMVDVNGRRMVVEKSAKVSAWQGALAWKYVGQDFWEELRRFVETEDRWTMDVERSSLDGPLDLIENLYPVSYPKFTEKPGVPGLTDVSLNVVQLTA